MSSNEKNIKVLLIKMILIVRKHIFLKLINHFLAFYWIQTCLEFMLFLASIVMISYDMLVVYIVVVAVAAAVACIDASSM